MKLRLTDQAIRDLMRLRDFLIVENPAAAGRLAGLLWDCIASLEQFPGRGRPVDKQNVRQLIVPFGRNAYLIRYRYLAHREEVVVMGVWHSRENRRR